VRFLEVSRVECLLLFWTAIGHIRGGGLIGEDGNSPVQLVFVERELLFAIKPLLAFPLTFLDCCFCDIFPDVLSSYLYWLTLMWELSLLECWTAPCMSRRFYTEPQEQSFFVWKEITGIREIRANRV
jgi:hypothetical protein